MAKPFATVEDVAKRAREEISAPADVELAEILLEIVSEEIRAHGESWPDPFLAPPICRTIAIRAATRGYLNPDGYETERGDMLTLYRGKDFAAGEALTASEIRQIKAAAGLGGIISVAVLRPVFHAFDNQFIESTDEVA